MDAPVPPRSLLASRAAAGFPASALHFLCEALQIHQLAKPFLDGEPQVLSQQRTVNMLLVDLDNRVAPHGNRMHTRAAPTMRSRCRTATSERILRGSRHARSRDTAPSARGGRFRLRFFRLQDVDEMQKFGGRCVVQFGASARPQSRLPPAIVEERQGLLCAPGHPHPDLTVGSRAHGRMASAHRDHTGAASWAAVTGTSLSRFRRWRATEPRRCGDLAALDLAVRVQ